ncbi:hypothetical protein GCM10007863_45780 [Dyella mobilis]|uniref:Uncharacterized protein n=2 Tax=Pseudomonadota TaxID=1224 RepID=A0ABQ6DFT9_9HYPH|nr:hypothetical protein GCM10007863_45780 [Dyella mobilis]GLS47072.1 hypothetical protein GCM10007884_50740 [Methylobacterium brachythecii]GLS61306.1 hypothetical protein GCM10007887_40090 [Methylobacterium haplocladii]GLT24752.1 hypothetical protein GCM10007933_42480 [Zoogloea oryzae]
MNRGTPEHSVFSDVRLSMDRVTHYFEESFLEAKANSVNSSPKYHLSDSIVEESPTIFSEELARIYLIHA